MERSEKSSRDHHHQHSCLRVKEPWRYSSLLNNNNPNPNPSSHESFLGAFSWPPRSYTCSFCEREFRSAQALGGHMNVHRRDRARLRSSPPWEPQKLSNPCFRKLDLNLSPCNPNPNPRTSIPNLNLSPPSHAVVNGASIRNYATYTLDSSPPSSICFRNSRVADEDLRDDSKLVAGVVKNLVKTMEVEGAHGRVLEEGLDLELRLGYGFMK